VTEGRSRFFVSKSVRAATPSFTEGFTFWSDEACISETDGRVRSLVEGENPLSWAVPYDSLSTSIEFFSGWRVAQGVSSRENAASEADSSRQAIGTRWLPRMLARCMPPIDLKPAFGPFPVLFWSGRR